MRAAFLAVLLLSSVAHAQKIRLMGGSGAAGGGTLDPARNDVAASYTATGPNGVKTASQASPAALSACAALSGAYASAIPVTETQASPYYCGGVTWRRIWTDEEGVTASPDRSLAAYTFVAQAMAGAYAFKANNRAIFDFGDGVNDECVSLGSSIQCGSLKVAGGQSFMADIVAPSSANTNVTFINAGRFWLFSPTGNATCGAGQAGGLQGASADGNRPRWCDGTAAYRISRLLEVPVTFDFPSIANGSCSTSSVTVTGAAVNDTVTVNADFALPADVMVGNARSTAANTVELKLCNVNLTTSQDPASGSYRFRIER